MKKTRLPQSSLRLAIRPGWTGLSHCSNLETTQRLKESSERIKQRASTRLSW